MPKRVKARAANKRALTFAVRHKYRAYPVLGVPCVHAGDVAELTLDLGFSLSKREKVALSGVIAPSQRTQSAEEKQLARNAKKALVALLDKSCELECVVDGKDKTGRTTGVLFSGEAPLSINEQLMNGGFVWSTADERRDLEMLQTLQGVDEPVGCGPGL
jgi:micrococcal nuclease